MPARQRSEQSWVFLKSLRDMLAEDAEGQTRLNKMTRMVAESMGTDVCSIYLLRDSETLELCATEGLNPESVHKTRLRIGEGLVGRVARTAKPVNTPNAPAERDFRFMPETGEEIYSSFLGVPLQRLGETLGVLVIQSRDARTFNYDEIFSLEVVAMVLAEMAELGTFVGEGAALAAPHTQPLAMSGGVAHDGIAEGSVLLHEPRVVLTNPVTDDPERELARLDDAMSKLRGSVNDILAVTDLITDPEHREVLETYRMSANSEGWVSRMRANIESGLSAEASVDKEQSAARSRMTRVPDAYLRERLHDMDDLFNRLLRILTGQGRRLDDPIPEDPILVARNIGPAELLEYGRTLKGVVLEEGSVGSHATIVARALGIPLIIHVEHVTAEALNGDPIIVDAEQGTVHLRPTESVASHIHHKVVALTEARQRYQKARDEPATTQDGVTVHLHINAGLLADLPNLKSSGAEGVGLFRTEFQFLSTSRMPSRSELAEQYSRVLRSAEGRPVAFRTIDVGSDKLLPYLNRDDEPNPAMGWRAIRVALDRTGIMKMQLQALVRGAEGRSLAVMFPLVAELDEFIAARKILLDVLDLENRLGHPVPESLDVGAMLETPSLAFAPDRFFETADFVSIGGNDLKQFFFAADRENERVRSRYQALNVSYLNLIEKIVGRCRSANTHLSYCGEDAGDPYSAVAFAAIGLRKLSMRSAAIGRVKHALRQIDLAEARRAIEAARSENARSVKSRLQPLIERCL